MISSVLPIESRQPIFIKKSGAWYHGNTEIVNEKVIHYFFSALQKIGGRYYLVTDQEREEVIVEDTPLLVRRVFFYEVFVEGKGNSAANEACEAELFCQNHHRFSLIPEKFFIRKDGEWITEVFYKGEWWPVRFLDGAKQDLCSQATLGGQLRLSGVVLEIPGC